MDSALTPRDIQTRIRAGESPTELAESSGLELDRVERFAAPVLAEREHMAALALAASVRRRGETSGHRQLRATVSERLLKRGLDVDDVAWDSHRMADGRWAVTGTWTADDATTATSFLFDPRGRFSVPADDEARRLIGEQPPAPRTRTRPDEGDEPTVDLTDELALVRAVQGGDDAGAPERLVVVEQTLVEETEVVVVEVRQTSPAAESAASDEATPTETEPEPEPVGAEASQADEAGELGTLYAMLGADGYSEDSPRVYAGLSDASAVPAVDERGWEPPVVIDVPAEPGPSEEASLPPGEHPDRSRVPMDDKTSVELSAPVDPGPPPPDTLPGTDEPAPPPAVTDATDRSEEADEFQLESEPPPVKKPKRKRASVPSWDEIMFGGPKPPSP